MVSANVAQDAGCEFVAVFVCAEVDWLKAEWELLTGYAVAHLFHDR
jgi:hypothetical protein